ncbi:response regulator [Paraglaciecola aquimarina]|uniref:histidine kinase n=1 Tax=Paraglaciecola algarum TaxID=3050085 RepID=A0ABS9DA59_9ALTE|nr:response regulator [Paraglaciecola sp. G1-23]MCF2949848.1 response regulator [Paraglaciecola sp. G1-23]
MFEKQQVIQRLAVVKKVIQQDLPTADKELQQIKSIIQQNQYDDLASQLLNLRSYANIFKQDYPQAFKYLLQARKSASTFDNQLEIAKSLRLEGLILDLVGEHAKAIAALNKSLAIFNDINPEQSLLVYGTLTNVYSSLNQYEQVLTNSRKHYLLAQKFNNDFEIAEAQFGIANALIALNQLSEAKYHIALAEELAIKSQYPFIGNIYSSKTKLHLKEGNLEAALSSIIQSAEADKQIGFVFGEGDRTLQLAEVYQHQGTPNLAITELTNKLHTGPIQNDKLLVLKLLDKLSELHQAKGDFKQAYEYASQHRQVYQQSYNERQSQQLALNQVKLDVQEKDQQISQLTKEQELSAQLNLNQQYVIALLIMILIMFSVLIYRNVKHKQRLQAFSEEVQAANDAKSDFLARMSHEIRTPINAVIGLTKLTQKTQLNQQQQTNLQQIEESSHTLLGVINDILDFSKIEAGKLTIDPVPFELDSLIDSAIKLQSLKANEKNLELIQYIEHNVPLRVIGDALRIQQILNNLISNAVKFTETGVVSVLVTQTLSENQSMLQFSVKDTGIGLTEEQTSRLFQEFSQADESTTRQYGGTGLGLAICKQLVELMHGQIDVQSQPGKGSNFTFTIPLQEQEESSSNKSQINTLLSKLRILIVDDIDLSRQVIAEALLRIKVTPDLAENGLKAVELIRLAEADETPYDLVIIDWKMPDIDGIQLASIINQQTLRKKPQLAMLSAYDMDKLKELGQPLGVKHYLEKPLNSSAIVDSLMNMFAITQDVVSSNKIDEQNTYPVPDLTGKRLLLVEDNALNRKVAKGFLADTQIQVVVAENGQEAIELLKNDQGFNIILMDVQMPIMDGITATQIIRNELHLSHPIIALTAHAMTVDIDKCIAAGMNGHISKPIYAEHLYQELNRLLPSEIEKISEKSSQTPDQNFAVYDEIAQDKAIQLLRDDETLYWELVTDFIQMENQITELNNAIKQQDFEALFRILHTYRTSLSYIGAYKQSNIAATLEQNIKENKPNLDADLIQQLIAFATKTKVITEHFRFTNPQ